MIEAKQDFVLEFEWMIQAADAEREYMCINSSFLFWLIVQKIGACARKNESFAVERERERERESLCVPARAQKLRFSNFPQPA